MSELYVIVKGDVTGVGFRAWVAAQANALGLTGWVRNKGIGVVEVVFQGKPSVLGKMLGLIGQGPGGVIIETVEQFWGVPSEVFDKFTVV